jgi:hypothetical protein
MKILGPKLKKKKNRKMVPLKILKSLFLSLVVSLLSNYGLEEGVHLFGDFVVVVCF